MNSQRRNFIVATSAVAMAVLAERLPGVKLAGAGSTYDELLARVLEALHHHPQGKFPVASDEKIRPLLARVLGAPADDLDSYATVSPAQLKQRIQDNIVSDYKQRRLRVVEGWWLSDTEAGCLELVECVV